MPFPRSLASGPHIFDGLLGSGFNALTGSFESGPLDPEVSAWRAAVAANGGTVSASTALAVSQFVRGCKADGTWGLLLDVGLFAGVGDLNAALVKLKAPAGVPRVLTNVNFVSGDYTATGSSAGLLGNGSSKRLDTSLPLSAHTSASGASLGIYAASMETTIITKGFIGVADVASASAAHAFILQESSGSRRAGIANRWTAAPDTTVSSTAVADAHQIVTRVSSTDLRFFSNGSQLGSTNTASVTGVPSGVVGLFCTPYGTSSYTYSNFSAMRARFYHIGLGLTAAQVSSLSARVNTLMTSFGANVY